MQGRLRLGLIADLLRVGLVQGVVTSVCPVLSSCDGDFGNFDPIRHALMEKGHDQLCALVYASVYYKKSRA